MLPLDQVKHRSNSGTIQASNSIDFHERAYKHEECLDTINMSLAKDVCMPIEGEACHMSGGASTYI